jgi:hypothetical protein
MAVFTALTMFWTKPGIVKVTAQDREIKEVSAEPGVSAVQLFFVNASSAGCQG